MATGIDIDGFVEYGVSDFVNPGNVADGTKRKRRKVVVDFNHGKRVLLFEFVHCGRVIGLTDWLGAFVFGVKDVAAREADNRNDAFEVRDERRGGVKSGVFAEIRVVDFCANDVCEHACVSEFSNGADGVADLERAGFARKSEKFARRCESFCGNERGEACASFFCEVDGVFGCAIGVVEEFIADVRRVVAFCRLLYKLHCVAERISD